MSSSAGLTESLLRPLLRTDPHRPRLTWYGGDPAGRTELSTASLANWAAKTAGLLVDELGVASGGLVRILGARSWQLLPAALGSWWAGLAVDLTSEPVDGDFADAVIAAPDADPQVAAAQLADAEPDTYLTLTTHPLALPAGDPPPGARDFSLAVRAHADRFPGVPVDPTWTVVRSGPPLVSTPGDDLTVAGLRQRVARIAAGWGPQPRILLTLGAGTGPADVIAVALAAWSADGSLVVADRRAGFDADTVSADEQTTVTATTPFSPGV